MTSTVGQLRALLHKEGWSPEDLALKVPVSNMTWRRLLAKPDRTKIPEKYQRLITGLSHERLPVTVSPEQIVVTGFALKPQEIVEEMKAQGLTVDSSDQVLKAVSMRQKLASVPGDLVGKIKDLLVQLPSATHRMKLVILGGFLYFLNPFDLIADAAITVGFIDDLGVLALIHAEARSSNQTKKKKG